MLHDQPSPVPPIRTAPDAWIDRAVVPFDLNNPQSFNAAVDT